jgi:hypothetical protein
MDNWEGYGNELSYPNLRHYFSIWLQGQKEITNNLSLDVLSAVRIIETGAFRMRIRSATYSTVTFGVRSVKIVGFEKVQLLQ